MVDPTVNIRWCRPEDRSHLKEVPPLLPPSPRPQAGYPFGSIPTYPLSSGCGSSTSTEETLPPFDWTPEETQRTYINVKPCSPGVKKIKTSTFNKIHVDYVREELQAENARLREELHQARAELEAACGVWCDLADKSQKCVELAEKLLR